MKGYKCYSDVGLQNLLKLQYEKIERLKDERNDICTSWTEFHIHNHNKTIEKTIKSIELTIQKIQEEINSREI